MAGKTAEERIAAIDEKIAKKQAEIDALEAQKQRLLHPVNSEGSWVYTGRDCREIRFRSLNERGCTGQPLLLFYCFLASAWYSFISSATHLLSVTSLTEKP